MVSFVKKADPQPPHEKAEDNRFDQIRKAAAERRKKSDTDEARSPPHIRGPETTGSVKTH